MRHRRCRDHLRTSAVWEDFTMRPTKEPLLKETSTCAAQSPLPQSVAPSDGSSQSTFGKRPVPATGESLSGATTMTQRICQIVDGSLLDAEGRGDGAYDLLDVAGTPEEIGKAIADSLREADLGNGSNGDVLEGQGRDLFLELRI